MREGIDNINEEEFWDLNALELPEEAQPVEVEEEEEEVIEETDDETVEETDESEETQESEEEEESDEEDEVIAKGYELFKDSIFKHLPEDYKFEATEEGFENALKAVEVNLFEDIHSKYLGQLEGNEKAKAYLDFLISTEGQGDFEKWMKVNSTDLSGYTEEDLKDTDVAKAVLTEYLKFQGMEDEDILVKLEDAEDFGTLEKEAKIALKYIPKAQEKETTKLVEDYKTQKKSRDEVYTANYDILKKTADQINLPKEKKQKVVDTIMKPVRLQGGYETTEFNLILNQVQTNPEHIIQLTSLLLDYDPTKGFNLSKVTDKKENTKVAKNFRQKLAELDVSSPIGKTKGSHTQHRKTKAPDITEGEFF
jgi:hypothetical protein